MNGKLFATIRRTAGLTQAQMGVRLGVSRQLVQKIETDERTIQPYIITRLYIEFGAEFIEDVRRINDNYIKEVL